MTSQHSLMAPLLAWGRPGRVGTQALTSRGLTFVSGPGQAEGSLSFQEPVGQRAGICPRSWMAGREGSHGARRWGHFPGLRAGSLGSAQTVGASWSTEHAVPWAGR